MKKKATRKDFYMEIRKSPGRFLSIFFIVAMGVAFFSGIRSSEPSMRITGDSYFDSAKLMDIKAVSTLGITDDDVKALEEVDGVAKAEGAYSADFLQKVKDEEKVLHVMSLQKEMNQPTVTEGRLPKKAGECLVDDESDYKVGDKIKLSSGTDDAVTDTLTTDTLTVVGTGNSPCYISFNRGSTTIGTGSIFAFALVTADSFNLDVYTEAYLQVEGAKDLTAYTDAYENRIEDVMKSVKKITGKRGAIRRQELVDDANEKLDDARQKLKDGQEEANTKLADAAAQIADAQAQLDSGREQISDGRNQIEAAKETLDQKQQELDAAQAEYQAGAAKIASGRAEYENGLAQYQANKDLATAQIESGRSQMETLADQIKQDKGTKEALDSQITELQSQIETVTKQIEQLEAQNVPDTNEDLIALKEQLTQLETGLATAQTNSAGLEQKIAYEENVYQTTTDSLDQAEVQLRDSEAALEQARSELEAGEAALSGVPEQLAAGQSQINEARAEIQSREQTLSEGEAEIITNQIKLEEAKQDYADGKKVAEEELADGQKKIDDAEAEISDIPEAKWYVYDRSTLPEYSGYGENADRMRAIGKVFPVIFFLVAALISLTSMTRMVEEQRTAIGTMKALGYSKMAIASKYMGYAILATVGGSIFGVLVGEKLLPYIIIYAYGILYHHLPAILTPYNWYYAAVASGISIVCITAATFFACYKELMAQPAVLMRPPAPKIGKRVLLERVGFVWRHLNFSWKSTVRNLMRYKKRFFMTIFGISGCMALMLVGFGLKDSIFEITQLQYKEIQVYDGVAYLQDSATDEEKETLKKDLDDNPEIVRHMDTRMKNVTLVNGKKERSTVECVLSDTKDIPDYVHLRDRKTKETYTLSDNGVILSEKTAKLLDIKEGDTVEIKDEENGNQKVKVEHICENYMGHYMYMTPSYYEKVHGETPEYNSFLYATPSDYGIKKMKAVGKEIINEDAVLSISYIYDIQEQLDDMLKSLNLVIVVLIVSAGMLAFVVLYNLNTINITERQRELATLKVLGFYDPEVGAYVYRENILLTFIGAGAGCILGKILHRFIIETVEVDSVMFGRNIDISSFLYALLFTVLFSLIINGVMYFKLKKIDMVESLKSIE